MFREPATRLRTLARSLTYGEAALAAFVVAVGTGVALAVVYDPAEPLTTVALMPLANPAASFLRNLHYWATQALLILSILHVWDHVRRNGDRRMRTGPWLRVCLSVPIVGLLAWSGFVLKGDVEAQQALRVVFAAVDGLPGIGPFLSAVLVGRPERVHLVYVHHVATFTLALWVIALEHGRALWPRAPVLAAVVAPLSLLAAVGSPALHDGLSATVKGPWFLIGLQEALHWSASPGLVMGLACLPLLLLVWLRWLRTTARSAAAGVLLAMVAAYAGMTVVGWAFRGDNWAWGAAWRSQPPAVWWGPALTPTQHRRPLQALPMVMGRPEGCLVCHEGVTGLSAAHDPGTLGCASCHRGNVFSLDAAAAHSGMIVVAGNLADAPVTCGGACHATVVERVEQSIMTTLAGIVAVNRMAWGEPSGDPATTDIRRVGFSPADSHLRGLCASCHLGTRKTEPGPVTERSRGGGCTACHAVYSPAAVAELRRVAAERSANITPEPARVHPDVSLRMTGMACFGCHSRSGRISLSYEGWHEIDAGGPAPGARTRTLEDGRRLVAVTPDAHFEKGMTCIDCHTAREVMGDGVRHARKSLQARVTCEDCHRRGPLTTRDADADEETRRIVRLRGLATGGRPLVVAASGDIFVNAFVDDVGTARLLRKADGTRLDLRPPLEICRSPAHARVSCIGCHSAWAPRCVNCHTRFDPAGDGYDLLDERETTGAWIETGSHFVAVPPTLGVRRLPSGDDVFDPFIPGMIATLDRNREAGQPPRPLFRRLYARSFSHTVTRGGRSCQSCHTDPVALGYGEGRLTLVPTGSGRGRWQFEPAHASTHGDGLPDDAWIAPGRTREGSVSTRDDVRPLSDEEQQRVLGAGACLTCHRDDSAVMRASLQDFAGLLKRLSRRCVVGQL